MGNVNERLRIVRRTLGLTQKQFGEKIGTSLNVVGNYETEQANPGRKHLSAIRHAFNVSMDWLETGQGEMFLSKEDKSKTAETISSYGGIIPSVVVPVLARVPAGFPEEIQDEVIEYITVPDVPKKSYAVIVKGDSMSPAIKDGDYAIFISCSCSDIVSGNVVLVRNRWGESHIKRYRKKGEKHYLTSDNPDYPTVDVAGYKIIGKVIKIWRNINF